MTVKCYSLFCLNIPFKNMRVKAIRIPNLQKVSYKERETSVLLHIEGHKITSKIREEDIRLNNTVLDTSLNTCYYKLILKDVILANSASITPHR